MSNPDPQPTELTRRPRARRLTARQIARSKLLIFVAASLSFMLSVGLWFTGNESQGIFVGLWVPSILSFGSLMLSPRNPDS